MTKNFLNLEGHQSSIIGSKVTAITLIGLIWPIVGVASGRVCACSLSCCSLLERGKIKYYSIESFFSSHSVDVFGRLSLSFTSNDISLWDNMVSNNTQLTQIIIKVWLEHIL